MQSQGQEQNQFVVPHEHRDRDQVDNFPFMHGKSMAGSFYLPNLYSAPFFSLLRPERDLGLPKPYFFGIPKPYVVLSSSGGLVLVRDLLTLHYHVLNPFIPNLQTSYRQIPRPPHTLQPHSADTPAVLCVDLRNLKAPAFHIICPMQIEMESPKTRKYICTFVIFSSSTNRWSSTASVCLRSRIDSSTGVSNGQGMVFWLTEVPHVVVKFSVTENLNFSGDVINIPQELIGIPQELRPCASLQLGTLTDSDIGLVIAFRADMNLLLLKQHDHSWQHLFHWKVDIEDETEENLEAVLQDPRKRPKLLRFEKEVPLWVNGKMLVWEIRWENQSKPSTRLHKMPSCVKVTDSHCIRNSVPYVHIQSPCVDKFLGIEVDHARRRGRRNEGSSYLRDLLNGVGPRTGSRFGHEYN